MTLRSTACGPTFAGMHVSLSVFGGNRKFSRGAVHNAVLAPQIYPGSVVRVYHDKRAHPDDLSRLDELRCQLVDMSDSLLPGMFWRFLINDDPRVERWISRDADSRLNPREAAAVREWIDSGRRLHIMRDHPYHCVPILGGMFGVHGRAVSMEEALAEWRPRAEYGDDQQFLAARILPRLRRSVLVHDDLLASGDFGLPAQGFPVPRNGSNFVGAVYDENDVVCQSHVQTLESFLSRTDSGRY